MISENFTDKFKKTDACSIFNYGYNCYKSKNFNYALECFQITANVPKLRNKSYLMLSKVYRNMGDYYKARVYLNHYSGKDDGDFKSASGALDRCEYNFNRSCKTLENLKNSTYNISVLASAQFQLGNVSEALDMLDNGINTEKYQDKNFFYLAKANIYLASKHFEKARSVLSELNYDQIEDKYKNYFNTLDKILKYEKLGEIEKTPYQLNSVLNNDLKKAYEHFELHKLNDKTKIGFYNDINMEELLDKVGKKMKEVNPVYGFTSNSYIIKMKENIGVVNESNVNSICVVVISGIEKIITLYPIRLSYEFNSEHLLYSKRLKNKRISGTKNI